MSDVASLLLEIETAQKANNSVNVSNNTSESQFLGSLFDKDEDDIDNLIKSKPSSFSPDLSLCISGKSSTIYSSKTNSDSNCDLVPINSISNEVILTDKEDIRHKLSSFEMNEIISKQKQFEINKNIYSKQWEENKEWNLRDEKLLLIQENTACTIKDLENERYGDFYTKTQTDKEIDYEIDYIIPDNLLRPKTKNEHKLMEKVAKWVTDKGIQFESMIKIKQINNDKFAFLAPAHQMHSYYNFLKQRFKTPHLFIKKKDINNNININQNTNTNTNTNTNQNTMDAATSIASHFLNYYSDNSDNSDNSDSNSNHSNNSIVNKSDNRSPTPTKQIKRSGKNSKRRKAMERERKYKKKYSRWRSRSRSRSWSRSRSRSRTRSSCSSDSYYSNSSLDSFYRDRKTKTKTKRERDRSGYRYERSYSRSRSRSRSWSRSRDRYRKGSKRRYQRKYRDY